MKSKEQNNQPSKQKCLMIEENGFKNSYKCINSQIYQPKLKIFTK